MFLAGINNEECPRLTTQALNAAKAVLQPLHLVGEFRRFLLCEDCELSTLMSCLEFLKATDPHLHRGLVRHHAAKPTLVHPELARTLGSFLNRLLRLLLGTDEQDAVTAPGHVTDEVEC